MGDTDEELSNTEIEFLFRAAKLTDPGPMTKRDRIYNAFARIQNETQQRNNVMAFIRHALKPARHVRRPERYESLRANLNRALSFAGLVANQAGELQKVEKATTLTEAERRARELRADLEMRGVHPDVLQFCRAELVEQNYFHAVQEAVRSVAAKLGAKTGPIDDGGALIDRALFGSPPMLAINPLPTVSEKSEQSGFANLVKGTFGMFRNPTAHEARINWIMTQKDAEDLLTIVSMIHRRLDGSQMPSRTG